MARPVPVEAITSYLAAQTGIPASTDVPSTRPARFITLRRLGGRRLNLAQEQPLVEVRCWGTSTADAFKLACDAWQALDAADGTFAVPGVYIGETGLSSPVSLPDPDTGQARYQFTANMVVSLAVS